MRQKMNISHTKVSLFVIIKYQTTKMERFLWLSAMMSILMISCKNDSSMRNTSAGTRTINEDSLIKSGYTRILSEAESEEQIQAWRLNADAVIKFRSEEDNNKSWAILTTGVWEEEFVFEAEMDKPEKIEPGNWIQYNDDLSYTYGHYDEVKGSGRYHYNPDTKLLIMLDDDPKKAPTEYEAQIANSMMVWSGQLTYKNNGTQKKLIKIKERPSKEQISN